MSVQKLVNLALHLVCVFYKCMHKRDVFLVFALNLQKLTLQKFKKFHVGVYAKIVFHI